jgi:hypothetical protein
MAGHEMAVGDENMGHGFAAHRIEHRRDMGLSLDLSAYSTVMLKACCLHSASKTALCVHQAREMRAGYA